MLCIVRCACTILIFLLWRTLSSSGSSAEKRQLNVTRMSGGDLLALNGNLTTYCGTFNAQCFEKNKPCKLCRCFRPRSTFVRNRTRCVDANEMTSLSCQAGQMVSRSLLVLSTLRPYIRIRKRSLTKCEIKRKNPEFFSSNGTWVQMMDHMSFSLHVQGRGNWKVSFATATISKMNLRYPGRIAKMSIRCLKGREKTFTNVCLVFKIAGTLKMYLRGNIESWEQPYRPATTLMVYSSHSTTATASTNLKTSSSLTSVQKTPKGDITGKPRESGGGKGQLIWIITSVLIVIIILLIAVIFFVFWHHKNSNRLNTELNGRPHELQIMDSASKQIAQGQETHEENGGDHIYATISETNAVLPTCSSPNAYQELQPTDHQDTSVYQSLVHQELQYVDVL